MKQISVKELPTTTASAAISTRHDLVSTATGVKRPSALGVRENPCKVKFMNNRERSAYAREKRPTIYFQPRKMCLKKKLFSKDILEPEIKIFD